MPFVDLVQVGSIGLLRAVRNFDPDAGVRLTSYSHQFILWPINKAVRKASRSRMDFLPPDRLASIQERGDPIDYGPRNRALDLACEQLLNPAEREVLELSYGDLRRRTYREIGPILGRSKPKVGRIHRDAIAKLRHRLSPLNPSAA